MYMLGFVLGLIGTCISFVGVIAHNYVLVAVGAILIAPSYLCWWVATRRSKKAATY